MTAVLISTGFCLGGVVGLMLGKIFTEREMSDHALNEFNRGFDFGYEAALDEFNHNPEDIA